MPTLSKHTALLNFDPLNTLSPSVEPISCYVTVNETWSPYVTASVVVPTSSVPATVDPRNATYLGLRLQQDFGDLVYVKEITADYTPVLISTITAAYTPVKIAPITWKYTKPWNIYEAALPLSKVTTTYAPVTPLKLTNANLATVWRMSNFLHSTGTFNPAPSTVFNGYLMLRSIEKNYLTGESTLELTSHEAILQEAVGYTTSVVFTSSSLKAIVNYVLNTAIGIFVNVEAGASDYTYSTPYGLKWAPNQTGWDVLNALVTAADRVLYCDEAGKWYLKNASSVSGSLALKDTDNITTLTSSINRNNPNFFDYAIVEYRNTTTGVSTYDSFGTSGFNISKDRYFLRENVDYPGAGAAQSMVWRAITRGELYKVEAISNYDARPRQTMTIDITGEPLKTATIQSVTWSLPSARMSVDIRDLV